MGLVTATSWTSSTVSIYYYYSRPKLTPVAFIQIHKPQVRWQCSDTSPLYLKSFYLRYMMKLSWLMLPLKHNKHISWWINTHFAQRMEHNFWYVHIFPIGFLQDINILPVNTVNIFQAFKVEVECENTWFQLGSGSSLHWRLSHGSILQDPDPARVARYPWIFNAFYFSPPCSMSFLQICHTIFKLDLTHPPSYWFRYPKRCSICGYTASLWDFSSKFCFGA